MITGTDYICHNRFEGLDMREVKILIRRGGHLTRSGDLLYFSDEPVCVWRSLNAKQHFAVNHDGKGMKRGDLAFKLAYAPRGDGSSRFSEDEQELLRSKYAGYLKPLDDVILFNDSFFELDPEELQQLDEDLKNCAKVDEQGSERIIKQSDKGVWNLKNLFRKFGEEKN